MTQAAPLLPETARANTLVARRLGIDTRREAVIFMRKDCHVCRSEGFTAHARVRVANGKNAIIATLYQITSELLLPGEAGLSESAWQTLSVEDGGPITVSHARPLDSMSTVRARIYGNRVAEDDMQPVIDDIVAGRYSDIDIAAFITVCASLPLNDAETVALTRAMVNAGDTLHWPTSPIVDKHCIGGLPGNRTTPIVVAIVAACGLTMPKTSSRAITSPAGTADTMETLAPVALDIVQMRRVVEREGGCIVWGGAVRLSPADDILIRVERALDLDSEGQLVASILSKKVAAGSTHLVLDIPVGPTAKVRSDESAKALASFLSRVGAAFGLETRIVLTDGAQPVGTGIGPALEARDVLSVLQVSRNAPVDLRDRSVRLAGALLELGGAASAGDGEAKAAKVLGDGRAWAKFRDICEAQGGMRTPPEAAHRRPVLAAEAGTVTKIDNRRIAKVAKLAGAPDAKAAGLEMHVRLGDTVEAEQPLYTIHAETPGELAYALEYAATNGDIVGSG
ncbi:MAG: thymidine phosphorylase family protein [Proteobacteria bacterium]|nr:thymidine phosphorylase family protein [Pseudomonadota bacterium]